MGLSDVWTEQPRIRRLDPFGRSLRTVDELRAYIRDFIGNTTEPTAVGKGLLADTFPYGQLLEVELGQAAAIFHAHFSNVHLVPENTSNSTLLASRQSIATATDALLQDPTWWSFLSKLRLKPGGESVLEELDGARGKLHDNLILASTNDGAADIANASLATLHGFQSYVATGEMYPFLREVQIAMGDDVEEYDYSFIDLGIVPRGYEHARDVRKRCYRNGDGRLRYLY